MYRKRKNRIKEIRNGQNVPQLFTRNIIENSNMTIRLSPLTNKKKNNSSLQKSQAFENDPKIK